MKKTWPAVALVWMYQGKDLARRRAEVQSFDYPNFKIVESFAGIPAGTDLCVFWLDDDKPVTKDFIRAMTKPVTVNGDFQAAIHFWSGNAICLPGNVLDSSTSKILDSSAFGSDGCNVQSLLKLLLPVLDRENDGPKGRLHLAFSSTERLAPLSLEPAGFPN